MRIRSLVGTAMALVATAFLFAGQEGALKVLVLKPDRTPQVGATIRLYVAGSSPTQISSAMVAKTDQKGMVTFWKLSPGISTIHVEVEGYEAGAIRTYVQADKASHIQVLLRPLAAAEVGVEETFDALDPTSSTTGLNVKHEMIQTIPTGAARRITDLGILVPGVMMNPSPTGGGSITQLGDPSLAVAVNRDQRGFNSLSTNNYLLDGIDVSNPLNGRGSVNIMQDLIADVDIKTGGVSAEYQAKSGIFYNATTINGSNEWHGGVTTRYTSADWSAKPKEGRTAISEVAGATGFFVSGPLVKSQLWLVLGAEKTLNHGKVALPEGTASTPGEERGFTSLNEQNLFAKLTWQIDPSNRLVAEHHSNRNFQDDGNNVNTVTSWLQKTEMGGDRDLLWYSFQQPWLIADFKFGRDYQRTNVQDMSPDGRTTEIFSMDPLTPIQSQFGGYGFNSKEHTERKDYRADFMVPFSTGNVTHTLKFGYEAAISSSMSDMLNSPYYQNITSPMTTDELVGNGLTWMPYFLPGLPDAINNNPAYAHIKNALMQPGSDGVTMGDLGSYLFNEQDPKHPGTYNTIRTRSTVDSNPSNIKSTMQGFYVQDYMTLGGVTFSPGFRLDIYTIKDDLGQVAFKHSNLFAPRVSLAWDVFGDAKAKAYAYFGRYFNPTFGSTIRNLGTTKNTGFVEDIIIMGEWVNVFTAETSAPHYYVFADGTKMPYTDEVRLGYDHILKTGAVVNTFSVAGTYRKDKNLVEGFSPNTYGDTDYMEYIGSASFNGNEAGAAAIKALTIPLAKFGGAGLTGQQMYDNGGVSFMNVPNGQRTFKSLDLTYKAESTKGLFLLSYSWIDARGTSMEVSDLTQNGSNPLTDARLPWMNGHLEGSLNWLVKAYGSYKLPGDVTVGVFGRMDSGYHYTPSVAAGGGSLTPDLPMDWDEALKFRVGEKMSPKRVNFDLHVDKRFYIKGQTQVRIAADIYNVFNNQSGVMVAEGMNVRAGVAAGQPFVFNAPRAVSLSAKLLF